VNDVTRRQLSLLEYKTYQALPKEVEADVIDLLVQLLIAVTPKIKQGGDDEQDHK
jgi:hypothetical protein